MSTYEFIKINASPTLKINRRLSPQNRVLSFEAFGRHYDIQLKQRNSILIGKKTPIWHAKTSPNNSSLVEYTLLSNVSNRVEN